MRNKAIVAGRAVTATLFMMSCLLWAQGPPSEPPDDLLDRMAGTWKLEGNVLGAPAHHTVTAEWVLNHQFIRMHEKTAADAPASERRYEAMWFIGYDAISEKYVVHLLDIFGPRYSETLGYGTRDGTAIRLVFEYPDGPFHTTYRWSTSDHSWQWQLEQKGKEGKWAPFADFKLVRTSDP
jgi:Protein of unknown function (DUF1579)